MAHSVSHWQCISGCGACCRLDPALRGEDLERLSPAQRSTYLAMVGEDGWCVHFDTGRRRCRIYDTRPDFCRVDNLMTLFAAAADAEAQPDATAPPQFDSDGIHPTAAAALDPLRGDRPDTAAGCDTAIRGDSVVSTVGTDGTDRPALDPAAQALAIASCRTQIRAEYGGRGRVLKRFEQAIRRTP